MKKKIFKKKAVPIISTFAILIAGALLMKVIADSESNARIKF